MSPVPPRRRALALLGLGAVVLGVSPAAAQTVEKEPRLRLRYGGDEDFAPFESRDALGKPQGFQPELLALLAETAGLEVSIELGDWPATEQALREGRLDAVAMVETPERRQWARFLRSHATPLLGLYLPRDRPQPQSLVSLADWRIAVATSEPMSATLQQLGTNDRIRFVLRNDHQSAMRAVLSDEADAALMVRAYGDRLVDRAPFDALQAAELAIPLQAYGFALSPDADPALAQRMQRGLDALERDGRLEALRRRWLASHRGLARADELQAEVALERWRLVAGGAFASLGLVAVGTLAWRRARVAREESQRRAVAETELRQVREQLEHSFVRNPDAMVVVALDSGRIVDANAALATLLGAPRESIVGRTLADLPALENDDNLAALATMIDRDGGFEAVPLQLRHPDKGLRQCLASCERMPGAGPAHVFALVRDVTEQMRHDRALREGYDELTRRVAHLDADLADARQRQQRAAAEAGELLQATTQALRGPVHTIRGLSWLVQSEIGAGRLDDARRSTALIDRAGSRMEDVLAGLAGLATVDREPLKRSDVDMRHCVVAALNSVQAEHPGRTVQATIDDDLPPARADASQMLVLWRQLMDNALKFSAGRPEAKVRVDTHDDGGRRWWRITDNGIGFEPARSDRLFRPFQRLHAEPGVDGTGIGLALVQRIVKRHDGEIRARSQPGVGTIIEFCLEPPPH